MKTEIEQIEPVESYIQGILISLAIGFIFATFFMTKFTGTIGFFGSIVCGIIISAICFFGGLPEKDIPLGHVGLITRFGKRIFDKVTSEGKVWLFPIIYSQTPILVKEKELVIGEIKPLEVLAVKPGSTERVPLTAQILVRYYIWDAPTSVNTPEEVAEKNIVKYINSTLRQIGASTEVTTFIENKKDVADAILRDFLGIPHESADGTTLTYNQQVEKMGRRIKDIELVKVDIPEELKKASAAQEIEKAQRVSDLTDVKTLALAAKQLRDDFPEDKLDLESALDYALVAQRKATKQVITGAKSVIATEGGLH